MNRLFVAGKGCYAHKLAGIVGWAVFVELQSRPEAITAHVRSQLACADLAVHSARYLQYLWNEKSGRSNYSRIRLVRRRL